MHEMLHSKSVSYLNGKTYKDNKGFEEWVVQFLNWFICVEEDIDIKNFCYRDLCDKQAEITLLSDRQFITINQDL